MSDFTEIWNLRNQLILDGYYTPENEIDGLELEKRIGKLANARYGWEPAAPENLYLQEETREWLGSMTAEERIEAIKDILIDWDGYRSVRGLGGLIDEIKAYASYDSFRSNSYLQYWFKLGTNATNAENYFNNYCLLNNEKIKYASIPERLYYEFRLWCKKQNYTYRTLIHHKAWNLIDVKIYREEENNAAVSI